MNPGSLHHLTSMATLAKIMVPVTAGCIGYGLWYRTVYGWTRTMNEEWYTAEEKMMEQMPRQGSATPIRINPFSDQVNMHLTRS